MPERAKMVAEIGMKDVWNFCSSHFSTRFYFSTTFRPWGEKIRGSEVQEESREENEEGKIARLMLTSSNVIKMWVMIGAREKRQ